MLMDQFLYRENLTTERTSNHITIKHIVPGNYYPITSMAYIEDQSYIYKNYAIYNIQIRKWL